MFSEKLKKYRQALGLTQEELAKRIFVTRSAVAKWEQGRGLPGKDSLDLLCQLFKVEEKDLLDYKDVDTNIRKSEKSAKRKWIAIIVASLVALGAVGTALGLALTKKPPVIYNPVWINTSISEDYLKRVGLNNLPIVQTKPGENTYLQSYSTDSDYRNFVTTIDSYDLFEKYTTEVYNFLMFSNPYISYVSTNIEHPENGWRNNTTGRFSQNFNNYLVPIQDKTDALESYLAYEDNPPVCEKYTFYYILKLGSDHKIGDSVDPFRISFTYYDEKTDLIAISNSDSSDSDGFTFYQGNFQMEIAPLKSSHSIEDLTFEKEDGSQITMTFDRLNYYLASELYDIDRVSLDNENFSDYLSLQYEPSYEMNGQFWIRDISDSSPLFHVKCQLAFHLLPEDSQDPISMKTRFLYAQDSVFLSVRGSNVRLDSKDIENGSSIFFLTRKEGAPDPYPDREFYL